MTPKQTALIRVTGLIGIGMLAGAIVNAVFTYFTVAQVGIGFSLGMLAYLIYMVYDIELDRVQRLEKLNNPDA